MIIDTTGRSVIYPTLYVNDNEVQFIADDMLFSTATNVIKVEHLVKNKAFPLLTIEGKAVFFCTLGKGKYYVIVNKSGGTALSNTLKLNKIEVDVDTLQLSLTPISTMSPTTEKDGFRAGYSEYSSRFTLYDNIVVACWNIAKSNVEHPNSATFTAPNLLVTSAYDIEKSVGTVSMTQCDWYTLGNIGSSGVHYDDDGKFHIMGYTSRLAAPTAYVDYGVLCKESDSTSTKPLPVTRISPIYTSTVPKVSYLSSLFVIPQAKDCVYEFNNVDYRHLVTFQSSGKPRTYNLVSRHIINDNSIYKPLPSSVTAMDVEGNMVRFIGFFNRVYKVKYQIADDGSISSPGGVLPTFHYNNDDAQTQIKGMIIYRPEGSDVGKLRLFIR